MDNHETYQLEEKRYQELLKFVEDNPMINLRIFAISNEASVVLKHLTSSDATALLDKELETAKAAYIKALEDRIAEVHKN